MLGDDSIMVDEGKQSTVEPLSKNKSKSHSSGSDANPLMVSFADAVEKMKLPRGEAPKKGERKPAKTLSIAEH